MPRNIEIKARVGDIGRLRSVVERVCDGPPQVLEQEDTFFNVPRGRLKLRVFADGSGELIFYERDDSSGPKQSDYIILPTDDPSGLKAVLAAAVGIRAVVRKKRMLYMAGQTRIHLDEVEGLGSFLELEVVLNPGQPADEGIRTADLLMVQLGVQREDLVEGAYVDLIQDRQRPQ